MARQKGIIKVEGSIGDLSFYSSVFGDIVRRKGGASKEKIRKSPAFKNLRRHHTEFANCAAAGKLLRQGWRLYTRQTPDHTLVWRVTQVMNRVKDEDKQSAWGKRTVARGFESASGRALLKGFELNVQCPLKECLKAPVRLKDQKFYLQGFVAKQQVVFPKAATHVRITALTSLVDLDKKQHRVYSDELVLERAAKKQDVVLAPFNGKTGGLVFYLLQLVFLQVVNGEFYVLKEGNCFGVLAVEVG